MLSLLAQCRSLVVLLVRGKLDSGSDSPDRLRRIVTRHAKLSSEERFTRMASQDLGWTESSAQEVAAPQPKGLKQEVGRSLLLILLLAAAGTLVITPRPTSPQVLPLPDVDQSFKQEVETEQKTRAQRARGGYLSKEVRAVGEQVRRAGLMMFQTQSAQSQLMTSLQKDAHDLANTDKIEELLDLRALQAELFLFEVRAWEGQQQEVGKVVEPSRALQELGGGFARVAALPWFSDSRKIRLDDDELRLLFRVHWGTLTALGTEAPFNLSLEELRRYYQTLLRHPPASSMDVFTQSSLQLSFALALGKVDPDYPTALSAGILQIRMGQFEQARGSLESFLQENPRGPWFNIARNHLGYCVLRISELNDH